MTVDVAALTALCDRLAEAATAPELLTIQPTLRFPTAACTWASLAGGEVLAAHGYGPWTLFRAFRPESATAHDWLVLNGTDVFVDLTAHQFRAYSGPLVDTGVNPLRKTYSGRVALHRARVPDGDPTMAAWRDALLRAVPPIPPSGGGVRLTPRQGACGRC